MKNIIKILALSLALLTATSMLTACGGDKQNETPDTTAKAETTEAKEEAPSGTVETWGNITLFVPEEMTLTGGSLLDKEDKNKLSLNAKSGSAYYNVSIVSAEQAESDIAVTKDVNASSNPEDVAFTGEGVEWKGVAYNYSGVDCFLIYASIDGKTVEILSGWNRYDSAQTKSVLGHIKVA